MGIVYRHTKEEPLSIEEMDGNFANLDKRLSFLETTPPLSEGIAKIVQEGDQITFQGTFGTLLGKAILPKLFPNPRGVWQSQTAYGVMDWVQVKRGVYTCLKPHTSTDFDSDKTNWTLVFEV